MGRYVDEGVIFEGVGVLGVVMFLVLICSGFTVRGSRFAVRSLGSFNIAFYFSACFSFKKKHRSLGIV